MNEEQPRLPARQATGSPGAPERWPGSFTSSPPRPAANARALEPRRDGEGSLAHVVETLLDKGLVLNADIMVSVAGVELLGIRLRAALASFETASRYGLEFPAGTDTDTAAWREAKEEKEACPQCDKKVPTRQLLEEWCPWCGWRSAQALAAHEAGTAAVSGAPGGSGEIVEGDVVGEDEPEPEKPEKSEEAKEPKDPEGRSEPRTAKRTASRSAAGTARKRTTGTARKQTGDTARKRTTRPARQERKEEENE
jgi:ribosomal protein L37AE/L43A